MKTNNCYTCKYKAEIPGSAHISCTLVETPHTRFAMAINVKTGRGNKMITIKDTGESLIEFNAHGIENGWCDWPIQFDPVWVTCKLPIE